MYHRFYSWFKSRLSPDRIRLQCWHETDIMRSTRNSTESSITRDHRLMLSRDICRNPRLLKIGFIIESWSALFRLCCSSNRLVRHVTPINMHCVYFLVDSSLCNSLGHRKNEYFAQLAQADVRVHQLVYRSRRASLCQRNAPHLEPDCHFLTATAGKATFELILLYWFLFVWAPLAVAAW